MYIVKFTLTPILIILTYLQNMNKLELVMTPILILSSHHEKEGVLSLEDGTDMLAKNVSICLTLRNIPEERISRGGLSRVQIQVLCRNWLGIRNIK